MFVDQQDFFYMLDKDGTACSAHLECIAIGAVEILLFQNAQNFTKVSHLTSQTRERDRETPMEPPRRRMRTYVGGLKRSCLVDTLRVHSWFLHCNQGQSPYQRLR